MSIENQERVTNKKESMETQSEREMRKNTEEVCDILRTLDPEDPRVESLCAEWHSRWMARVAAEPKNKRLPVYLNFLHARLDLESGKKRGFFKPSRACLMKSIILIIAINLRTLDCVQYISSRDLMQRINNSCLKR